MPNTPVYARIDGRAFHTFCRGLEKPFSKAFILVMQETCKFLVEETNACLGYVQSDEISLGWENIVKAPFDGRVQKLESNLASLASAKFIYTILRGIVRGIEDEYDLDTMLAKVDRQPPSFDCRVFNVPTMTELANCFLWRENDAIKNSISGMALNFYSQKELQNKNSDEKIHMMRMKGHCFYEDTDPAFMRGTFYHRENYLKALTDEEVAKIPEKQRSNLVVDVETDIDGSEMATNYACWRSHIVAIDLPYRLTETSDLEKVLFSGLAPKCKIENPTFNLKRD
jgi:tRNA(His) 5'-end guanylyltransferase